MKHTRIIVTHYGGPEELRVVEEDFPEPKDGEVRVRVLAAGVSLLRHARDDWLQVFIRVVENRFGLPG